MVSTVEPWFNKPLYDEVLSITSKFHGPSNSKLYLIRQNLVIANIVCQSLGPSWYQSSIVVWHYYSIFLEICRGHQSNRVYGYFKMYKINMYKITDDKLIKFDLAFYYCLRGPVPKKRPMVSSSKIESADFYFPSRGYWILFKN